LKKEGQPIKLSFDIKINRGSLEGGALKVLPGSFKASALRTADLSIREVSNKDIVDEILKVPGMREEIKKWGPREKAKLIPNIVKFLEKSKSPLAKSLSLGAFNRRVINILSKSMFFIAWNRTSRKTCSLFRFCTT